MPGQSSDWQVGRLPVLRLVIPAGDVVVRVLYTPSHTGERSRAEVMCRRLAELKGYTVRELVFA